MEQPLARVVASFFLNRQCPGPEYFNSPIQGTVINVRSFFVFLNERCKTKDTLLNSDRIKNNMQEIHLVQEGFNLWDGLLPKILEDYRENYILRDVSFPTNIHCAERAVKLANHCFLLNRQEASRTLCAVGNLKVLENEINDQEKCMKKHTAESQVVQIRKSFVQKLKAMHSSSIAWKKSMNRRTSANKKLQRKFSQQINTNSPQ